MNRHDNRTLEWILKKVLMLSSVLLIDVGKSHSIQMSTTAHCCSIDWTQYIRTRTKCSMHSCRWDYLCVLYPIHLIRLWLIELHHHHQTHSRAHTKICAPKIESKLEKQVEQSTSNQITKNKKQMKQSTTHTTSNILGIINILVRMWCIVADSIWYGKRSCLYGPLSVI